MGDRSNIAIQSTYDQGTARVYLYSHWSGESIIKSALQGMKSGRVNDSQYLARVIFQDMLGDDKGETGYGISARIHDNSYPVLVIDPDAAGGPKAWFEYEGGEPMTKKISTAEFVRLVENIPNWVTQANESTLYEQLIKAIEKSV